jgi:hypothetical protein
LKKGLTKYDPYKSAKLDHDSNNDKKHNYIPNSGAIWDGNVINPGSGSGSTNPPDNFY